MRRVSVLAAAASLLVMVPAAEAQIFGQPRSSAQRAQDRQISQVPRCDRTLGTLTIADGDNSAYDALQLQPPHTLLRMVVQRSGCFTIVERGNATMSAIERERALAGAGELQRGSNVGPGQMRAADYVLIAEVASENGNVSGGGFRANVQGQQNQNQQGGQPQVGSLSSMMGGGGLGGMIGGGLGGGLGGGIGGLLSGGSARGGINSQTGEANTVLSVVSVRTAETLAASQGYAAKRDVTWNLAGATTLGGFAGGGYETTESGRILAQAFINAYAQLVQQLNALGPTLPPPPIVEEPHAYAPPPPSAPAYAPHNPSGPAYGPTPPSGPAYAAPPPSAPAPAPAYGGKPGASGSQGPVAVSPGGSPK